MTAAAFTQSIITIVGRYVQHSEFHLPLLYSLANSWAPLCCGPHRGRFARLSRPSRHFPLASMAPQLASVLRMVFELGSSSSMEFSKMSWSVLTGVCGKRQNHIKALINCSIMHDYVLGCRSNQILVHRIGNNKHGLFIGINAWSRVRHPSARTLMKLSERHGSDLVAAPCYWPR